MNPHHQRILGIDFGLKRIGIAVSDPLGITAQGVCVIKHTNRKNDIQKIMHLIDKYEIKEIIIGMPRRHDNSPGTLKNDVEVFAKALRMAAELDIRFADERLTTVQAEKLLISADVRRNRRKEVIDKVAAQIMLQSHLDSLPRTSGDEN